MPPWPVFRAEYLLEKTSPGLGVQRRKTASLPPARAAYQLGTSLHPHCHSRMGPSGPLAVGRGLLWHGVTCLLPCWAFSPHTHTAHGVNNFGNDDDAQVCLLCQLPGHVHCLPLMAPPGERTMCLLCQLPGQAHNLPLMVPPRERTMAGERVRLDFPPRTLIQMSRLGWAGLGWAGFQVGSLLSSSCQDSQAGSVGSVSRLLHPEGTPLCFCLRALLTEAGQPIVPFFLGSGRALFITGGLAPKRENMRKRNFDIPYVL